MAIGKKKFLDAESWKVLKTLHPYFRDRVLRVTMDLNSLGYDIILRNGYRPISNQLKEFKNKKSKVKFGFHNVTNPITKGPESMAVHIYDRKLGEKPPKGHSFGSYLQISSERHGLRTGNTWKDPWDPAHVQLYRNDQLKLVKRNIRPKYLPPTHLRWPPTTLPGPTRMTPHTKTIKHPTGPHTKTIKHPTGPHTKTIKHPTHRPRPLVISRPRPLPRPRPMRRGEPLDDSNPSFIIKTRKEKAKVNVT
jgi:hypothetical protein